jgi:hypothetical protein
MRERPLPDFAEFIIGPANGRTRWLNPGYSPLQANAPRICAISSKPQQAGRVSDFATGID